MKSIAKTLMWYGIIGIILLFLGVFSTRKEEEWKNVSIKNSEIYMWISLISTIGVAAIFAQLIYAGGSYLKQ